MQVDSGPSPRLHPTPVFPYPLPAAGVLEYVDLFYVVDTAGLVVPSSLNSPYATDSAYLAPAWRQF